MMHDDDECARPLLRWAFPLFYCTAPLQEYVQHLIRRQGPLLWPLLQAGAAVLVAGSAGQMPKEVTSALERVVSEQTGASQEAASAWVKGLMKAGRLQVEAWA